LLISAATPLLHDIDVCYAISLRRCYDADAALLPLSLSDADIDAIHLLLLFHVYASHVASITLLLCCC